MSQLSEIYCDIFSLYNKIHTLHIRTVKMKDCATLHSLLGIHYELIESMQDTFGEDILQKSLEIDVPSPMECLKDSTIKSDMIYDDEEEIIDDLYKDYEYLKNDLKKASISEKDLLVQNLLIDMWRTMTNLCADITREMDDEVEPVSKENKTDMMKEKTMKMGIKAM